MISSSKPRVGESGRMKGAGHSEKVTFFFGLGEVDESRLRFHTSEPLAGFFVRRVEDGDGKTSSSEQMDAVGDDTSVEAVPVRELIDPEGECSPNLDR
jgi:hypothetical protein